MLAQRCSSVLGAPVRRQGTSRAATATQQRRCRSRLVTQAVLDAPVAAAVSQQAIAFAIVLGAEAAFSRSNVPEADPGRPSVVPVAAGVGGTLAAAALVGNGGGLIPSVGLVVGLVAAGYSMYASIQRARALQYDDGDFPGPRAWPSGMGIISFFAVCVFLQAIVADATTAV